MIYRYLRALNPTNPLSRVRGADPWADYIQAQRIRSRVKGELAQIFGKVDLLALPGLPGPAPTIKESDPLDTLYKHIAPEFLAPLNLAGLPAISVPCGFAQANLPVALQLTGKPFDELTV